MMTEIRRFRMFGLAVALSPWLCISTDAGDEPSGGATGDGISATLLKVQDTRRVVLAKHSSDDRGFDFNKPGLELTFSVTTPEGKQLVSLDQPERVTATDSTGSDLTDIEPDFMGHKKFVTLVSSFEGPPNKFTLRLAPPGRSAVRFSLSTEFDAWVFAEMREDAFEVGTKAVKLDAELYGRGDVLAALKKSGDNVHLTVTPGSVKQAIDSVELLDGDKMYASKGTRWSGSVITYMFSGPFKPELKARLKVRVGVEKLSCRISITDQPLP